MRRSGQKGGTSAGVNKRQRRGAPLVVRPDPVQDRRVPSPRLLRPAERAPGLRHLVQRLEALTRSPMRRLKRKLSQVVGGLVPAGRIDVQHSPFYHDVVQFVKKVDGPDLGLV